MPAESPFDPCKQWLGFDAVQLGNHRLVLGLSPSDSDPEVVRKGAEARIRLLQSLSPGPFELARNSLIKRVEEARDAVLAEIVTAAAAARPAGFAMPRPPGQLAAGAPPSPPAAMAAQSASAVPPAVAPPVPAPMGGHDQIVIRTTRYRRRTPLAGIALTILALTAAVGGLWWFKENRHLLEGRKPAGRERQTARVEPDAEKRPSQPKGKKPADGAPADPTSDRAVSTAERGPARPRRPEPSADDGESGEPLGVATSGKAASKDPAVPPSKKATEPMNAEQPERAPVKPAAPMAEREPETKPGAKPERRPDTQPDAKPGLKPEMKPEPKPEMTDDSSPDDEPAPTPPDTEKLDAALTKVFALFQQEDHDGVERELAAAGEEYADVASRKRVNAWKQLAAYAKGYSAYRDEALETVAAGDEYEYKGKKISIVEADRKLFKFRVSGDTKTFARDKIPSGIVLAIVTRWFDDNPANELYLGAHHVAKPEPDLDRAREHWERADARGAEATALLRLLDDPVIVGAAGSTETEEN